jgi:hypothetical protein
MDTHTAWKDTCRILLGGEIGELEEFGPYLSKYLGAPTMRKSSLSSRPVWVSSTKRIPASARLISYDEIEEYGKRFGKPADIDEIKDIDSIISALRERFCYAGNVVLGNSGNVSGSDACSDANHVLHSQNAYEGSKYVAYSDRVRVNEMCFGATFPGESKFVIRGMELWRSTRCFEVLRTFTSSDCYYTANMEGCTHAMFSFNQRGKSHIIGNLQLPKDRYMEIRNKLLEDIRSELEAKKCIMSIPELLAGTGRKAAFRAPSGKPGPEIQSAFDLACRVVLGNPLGPILDYEGWLDRDVGKIMMGASAISKEPVPIAPLDFISVFGHNAVTVDEALGLGKKNIGDASGLRLSNARERLKEIAITASETVLGDHIGMKDCACYGNKSMHCFRTSCAYRSRFSSNSHWPRDSEYMFGTSIVLMSKFCIKCYNSTALTRCFEVDSCHRCSDSYFCHNCEGLTDCMFCFNAKSLRYAIGNIEVGKEKYMGMKKMLLDGIAERLKKKTLAHSIYTIGA